MADIGTLSRQVTIEMFVPDSVPILYSNHVAVQGTENEVFVSFFQIAIPMVQSQEEYEKVEKVRANCVARIALARPVAAHFSEVLRGVVEAHAGKPGKKK